MRSLAAVVAAVLLTPFAAGAQESRAAALYYTLEMLKTGRTAQPLTQAKIRPVLAYVGEDGQARDWLVDTLIFYSYDLFKAQKWVPNLSEYEAALFDGGAQGSLVQLAEAVKALRVELGDPTYTVKVYLTAPFVYDQSATMVASAKTVMTRYATRFGQLNRPEIQLAGFYFGYTEDLGTSAAWPWVAPLGDHAHAMGLKYVWIPFAGWNPANSDWASFRFDRITPQPNYMDDNVNLLRFKEIDDRIRKYAFAGPELEFGGVNNPQVADPKELSSARSYLAAADQYNWAERPWTTLYHARLISQYATDATMRPVYDRLYEYTSARPSKSAATLSRVKPSADAFVSVTGGTSATSTQLKVGSETNGNHARAWIRFTLPALNPRAEVLSAHLHLLMEKVLVGPELLDGDLQVCTGTWNPSTITWANQPTSTCRRVNSHRFVDAYRYRMNVSNAVRDAIAAGRTEITFMVKKATEASVAAKVAFKASEAGDTASPVLQIRTWIPPCVGGGACSTNSGCKTGTESCSSGSPVCSNLVNAADGKSCGTDKVCDNGVCVGCSAGDACTTNAGCKTGTTSCASGTEVCSSLANAPDGKTCGTNKACDQGACVSCTAGTACEVADGCKQGTISCATGQPVCANVTNAANGTSCGTGRVCYAGACVACAEGAACTPTGKPCQSGTVSCATGKAVCADLAKLPDGTACGQGSVCNAGVCSGCVAGQSCSNADGCLQGTTDCSTGSPRCTGLTAKPAGTSCGTDRVCFDGVCAPCFAGAACGTADGCQSGVIECATGKPQCGQLADAPEGTECGTGGTCQAGACSACPEGASCATPDGCHEGVVSCASGKAVCTAGAPLPDGTSCGAAGVGVCLGGECLACATGARCSDPSGCREGTLECESGVPSCQSLQSVPDGTACGLTAVCSSGTCSEPQQTPGPTPEPPAEGPSAPAPSGCSSGTGAPSLAVAWLALLAGAWRRRRAGGTVRVSGFREG